MGRNAWSAILQAYERDPTGLNPISGSRFDVLRMADSRSAAGLGVTGAGGGVEVDIGD